MKPYKIYFLILTLTSCIALITVMWFFLPPEVVSDGAVIFAIAFLMGIAAIYKYCQLNKDKIAAVMDEIRKN
jgi:hypothetical protein